MSEIIKRDKSKIDDQWDRYQCTLSIINNFDKIFTGIEHYPVKLFVKIAFPSPSQPHNLKMYNTFQTEAWNWAKLGWQSWNFCKSKSKSGIYFYIVKALELQLFTAGFCIYWLWTAGIRPWQWQRYNGTTIYCQ